MSQKFRMPYIEVGMDILWYGDLSGTSQPSPGKVFEVGDEAIGATIFDASTLGGVPKTGIRHRTDPRLRMTVDADAGCWDYRNIDKITLGDLLKKLTDDRERKEEEDRSHRQEELKPKKQAA